tara:strand:- start:552 stop:959 length:408 start_codon:yes stop_codon:yes gene_type:complete
VKKKKKKTPLNPTILISFFEERENAPKEREEFHFFLEKRRERDHAPPENSLTHYFLRARSFSCRASFIAFVHRVVRTLFCHHLFRLQRREEERVKAKNVTRRNRGPRRGKRKGREGKKFDPTRFRFGIEPIVFCT